MHWKRSDMSNVVYKLECISCDKTYIGQQEDFLTSEEMNIRITLIFKKIRNIIML